MSEKHWARPRKKRAKGWRGDAQEVVEAWITGKRLKRWVVSGNWIGGAVKAIDWEMTVVCGEGESPVDVALGFFEKAGERVSRENEHYGMEAAKIGETEFHITWLEEIKT